MAFSHIPYYSILLSIFSLYSLVTYVIKHLLLLKLQVVRNHDYISWVSCRTFTYCSELWMSKLKLSHVKQYISKLELYKHDIYNSFGVSCWKLFFWIWQLLGHSEKILKVSSYPGLGTLVSPYLSKINK